MTYGLVALVVIVAAATAALVTLVRARVTQPRRPDLAQLVPPSSPPAAIPAPRKHPGHGRRSKPPRRKRT